MPREAPRRNHRMPARYRDAAITPPPTPPKRRRAASAAATTHLYPPNSIVTSKIRINNKKSAPTAVLTLALASASAAVPALRPMPELVALAPLINWDELEDGIKIKIVSELSFKMPFFEAMWSMGMSDEQCSAFERMYNQELACKLREMNRLDEKRAQVDELLKRGQILGEDNPDYIAATNELCASFEYTEWEPMTVIMSRRQAADGRRFLESFDFINDLPGIEEVLNVVGDSGVDYSWYDIYTPESHPGPCPWKGRWAIDDDGEYDEEEDAKDVKGKGNKVQAPIPLDKATGRKASTPAPKSKKKTPAKKPPAKKPPAKKQNQKKSGLNKVTNVTDLQDA